jgi:hypothetical protein
MKRDLRTWFDWLSRLVNFWVIVSAILVGISLMVASLAVVWITKPPQSPPGLATAVINIIPVPSATPTVILPTPIPLTPTATPPAGSGGVFAIGSSVQITGTGGDGLRLRSEPGLQSQVLFLAFEGEIFTVQDGPRSSDGYEWYFLAAPYDTTVRGWAAANFLQGVPSP